MITKEELIGKILIGLNKYVIENNLEFNVAYRDYKDLRISLNDNSDLLNSISIDKIELFEKAINIRSYFSLKEIMEIIQQDKYDTLILTVSIHDIYGIEIQKILLKCKTCGSIIKIKTGFYEEGYALYTIINYTPDNFCCYEKYHELKEYLGENNGANRIQYFEKLKHCFENSKANKGKFKLKTIWTVQCRHRHISFLDNKKGPIAPSNVYNPMTCWICDIEKEYTFFKMLKEQLGANYYIKQEKKHLKYKPKSSIKMKKIFDLIIYTYNDKKHLTGKIVFNDPFGEEQAKANSNHLVFRWFDIKYLDDYDYCKTFLYYFYKEIVKRNKLGK